MRCQQQWKRSTRRPLRKCHLQSQHLTLRAPLVWWLPRNSLRGHPQLVPWLLASHRRRSPNLARPGMRRCKSCTTLSIMLKRRCWRGQSRSYHPTCTKIKHSLCQVFCSRTLHSLTALEFLFKRRSLVRNSIDPATVRWKSPWWEGSIPREMTWYFLKLMSVLSEVSSALTNKDLLPLSALLIRLRAISLCNGHSIHFSTATTTLSQCWWIHAPIARAKSQS